MSMCILYMCQRREEEPHAHSMISLDSNEMKGMRHICDSSASLKIKRRRVFRFLETEVVHQMCDEQKEFHLRNVLTKADTSTYK